MAWISGNRWLNQSEMDNNAREFYNFFITRGWTLNAIAGAIGNAAWESHINPGIWQNLTVSENLGYGIFQWTPGSKVRNWLIAGGYGVDSGEGQLERVLYEKDNNLQYYPTSSFPLSFREFIRSTQTPAYLAEAWMRNYERPGAPHLQERIDYANYYYALLGGETPPAPPPDTPPDPVIPPTQNEDQIKKKRRMLIMISRRRVNRW